MAARTIWTRDSWRFHAFRRPLLAGLALLALRTLSCAEAPDPRPLNVVLIVVDTLRWDHLSGYGMPRSTTPHLDALARDGVMFRNAYAPSSWTLPSIVSLHTGLYPGSHGMVDPSRKLSTEAVTLAEMLHDAGYRTFATVSNKLIAGSGRRLDQGFETYLDSEARAPGHVSSGGVTRQAIDAVDALGAGPDPFFLYVHYFDPHSPYRRHPGIGFAAESAGRLRGGELIGDLRSMMDDLTDEELGLVVDAYDEEIRWTDLAIGRLLDDLRGRDLLDRTLLVVTADHGEEFLERGWIGHTKTLYEDLVRVPLIVRDPRGRGGSPAVPPDRRIATRAVSLVGVPATILEILGVEADEETLQEGSFADALAGSPLVGESPGIFLEVDYAPLNPQNVIRRTFKKGLVRDGWKAIRDDSTGVVELYDLAADGLERHDESARRPVATEEMVDALDDWIRATRARSLDGGRVHLTPENMEQLRALGYVGQ